MYFMSLSTVFSLILCENQGLTINQMRGGCLGACKVPGAPEPPQASPGRVQPQPGKRAQTHRQVNGHSAVQTCNSIGFLGNPGRANQSESVGASGAVWAPEASTGGGNQIIFSFQRGGCR